MTKDMFVYSIKNRLIGQRLFPNPGRPPIWSLSPSDIDAEAPEAEIGAWALRLLAARPEEDVASGHEENGVTALLRIAGERSWSGFARQARQVDVSEEDGDFVVGSWERDRGGVFLGMPNPIELRAPTASQLGKAILEALRRSRP